MVDDRQAYDSLISGTLILGRESEQSALRQMLDDLLAGRGGKVLISGDAGIGKTTLVRSLAAEATRRDVQVLAAACYELDVSAPFGIWREILGDELFSIGTASSIDVLRRQAFERLCATSVGRPKMLLLEDLQWADESSLDLLRYVIHQPLANRMLVVITCRDQDQLPDRPIFRFLPQFIREARPLRLALRPLGRPVIEDLINLRFTGLAEDDRDRLIDFLSRYGEGNPFFVEELIGMLEYQRILAFDPGRGWILGELPLFPVPPLVRQVIDGRLMQVNPDLLSLLEAAAVIGVEVPVDLWTEVCNVPSHVLASAIDEALQERIIEEVPGEASYRFRHALIHGVVYDRPNSLQRRALHRRTGEILAAQDHPEPSRVAHHFTLAGDPRAAEWLIEAGRRAGRSYALSDASTNYLRALEILERNNASLSDRTWLLCALAEANRYVNVNAALSYVNRAVDTLDQLDDPAMRVLAIWCHARIRGFNGERVIDDLYQASVEYGKLSSDQQQRILKTPLSYVVSQATLAQDLANYGQYEEAVRQGQAFLDAHQDDPSGATPVELGNVGFGMGMALAALGRPDEAREAFRKSREHYLEIDNFQLTSVSVYWELSFVSQVYDAEYPEIRRKLRQEEIEANRKSELARAAAVSELISTSETLILDGEWQLCRQVASARITVPASQVPSIRKLVHLDWLQGHSERARELVHLALPLGPDEPPGRRMFVHLNEIQWIAAALALDAGDLPLARRWIKAGENWLSWSGKLSGRYQPQLLWSRLHELDGDLPAAIERAQAALDLSREPREPLGILAAQRTLAWLYVQSGHAGRASTPLVEALDIARKCQAPYETALTMFVQAGMLHASGLNGDARQVLEEAGEIAARLGAAPLLHRIDELRSSLVAPTPRKSSGQFGLSPRELEVLSFVARGYTDARIAEELSISPRTVGGHLQSILNKTGTTSRTAATAFAYQHGILGQEPG